MPQQLGRMPAMYKVWMREPRSYATIGEARAAASAYERETGAIVAVTEDIAEDATARLAGILALHGVASAASVAMEFARAIVAEATPAAPAPETYNGWKNHSTWHVALVLGDDEFIDRRARAIVAEACERATAEAREDEFNFYRGDAERIAAHCAYVAGEALSAYVDGMLGDFAVWPDRVPYSADRRAECNAARMIADQCIASYMGDCDYNEIGEAYIRRIAEDAAYRASATAGAAQ
jgi:hypothetical protein